MSNLTHEVNLPQSHPRIIPMIQSHDFEVINNVNLSETVTVESDEIDPILSFGGHHNDKQLKDMKGHDFTLPGHNYMGPGTKIITNLRNNLMPTDNADLLSMKHDVAYLLANDIGDIQTADRAFRSNAIDYESMIAGAALKAKNILGFDEYFLSNNKLTENQRIEISKMANNIEAEFKRLGQLKMEQWFRDNPIMKHP